MPVYDLLKYPLQCAPGAVLRAHFNDYLNNHWRKNHALAFWIYIGCGLSINTLKKVLSYVLVLVACPRGRRDKTFMSNPANSIWNWAKNFQNTVSERSKMWWWRNTKIDQFTTALMTLRCRAVGRGGPSLTLRGPFIGPLPYVIWHVLRIRDVSWSFRVLSGTLNG